MKFEAKNLRKRSTQKAGELDGGKKAGASGEAPARFREIDIAHAYTEYSGQQCSGEELADIIEAEMRGFTVPPTASKRRGRPRKQP